MKQPFTLASSGKEDADLALLESLVECYNNATQWDTRRQILSIMVDKVSFKSLQRLIPNLTHYHFKIAKQHLLLHGRGCSVPRPIQKRMYVSPEMIDHFICFITSQHIVQGLPFGQKHLSLSSGQVLEVPNVIRALIPERIVQQYQEYCKESGITCLSRRSLLRILDVCSASVRKSLQGLDYITASGSKAFDELENVADRLGELGMGMSWAKQQRQQLKLAKRYLKSDYKVRTTKDLNKFQTNVLTRFNSRRSLGPAGVVSAGSFPETAAGNRAYLLTFSRNNSHAMLFHLIIHLFIYPIIYSFNYL